MSNTKLLTIKRAVLAVSSAYVLYLLWYVFAWPGQFFLDGGRGPSLVTKLTFLIGYPLIAVFPFSILTFRMDERIFRAWFNFNCIGVPILSIILIKLSLVENADSGGLLSGFNRWLAYRFGLVLPAVLLIISLGIIIWKLYWFRSQKNGKIKG
jgi:hypothetical protein